MNWEALGAVAELAGASAVLATLFYLAVQIRSGARQTNAQAYASIGERMHELVKELRQDPQLYALLLRASQDWGALTEEEKSVVHLWNNDEAQLYETVWVLWRKGAIDDIAYQSREDYFVSLMSMPGRLTWWKSHTFSIDPRFIEHINQRMDAVDDNLLEKYPFYKQ